MNERQQRSTSYVFSTHTNTRTRMHRWLGCYGLSSSISYVYLPIGSFCFRLNFSCHQQKCQCEPIISHTYNTTFAQKLITMILQAAAAAAKRWFYSSISLNFLAPHFFHYGDFIRINCQAKYKPIVQTIGSIGSFLTVSVAVVGVSMQISFSFEIWKVLQKIEKTYILSMSLWQCFLETIISPVIATTVSEKYGSLPVCAVNKKREYNRYIFWTLLSILLQSNKNKQTHIDFWMIRLTV